MFCNLQSALTFSSADDAWQLMHGLLLVLCVSSPVAEGDPIVTAGQTDWIAVGHAEIPSADDLLHVTTHIFKICISTLAVDMLCVC